MKALSRNVLTLSIHKPSAIGVTGRFLNVKRKSMCIEIKLAPIISSIPLTFDILTKQFYDVLPSIESN